MSDVININLNSSTKESISNLVSETENITIVDDLLGDGVLDTDISNVNGRITQCTSRTIQFIKLFEKSYTEVLDTLDETESKIEQNIINGVQHV